jgi:hypothetical protein
MAASALRAGIPTIVWDRSSDAARDPAMLGAEAAGFTHIALVQVGGDTQEEFITWAATELLPALRT